MLGIPKFAREGHETTSPMLRQPPRLSTALSLNLQVPVQAVGEVFGAGPFLSVART